MRRSRWGGPVGGSCGAGLCGSCQADGIVVLCTHYKQPDERGLVDNVAVAAVIVAGGGGGGETKC